MADELPEILPADVELYAFDDIPHWREDVFSKTLKGLESTFPRDYGTIRMELSDLSFKHPTVTPSVEKAARLSKGRIASPLKGTVTLRDRETGEVLDSVKNKTIMSVPYLTDRGTFMHNGASYSSIRQSRLLPGAYARRKSNGQLETHFNTKPGSGRAFRVSFDPESAEFRMNIGGSNLKLYSILHALGVPDQKLRDAWGDYVFNANASSYDRRDLGKLYSKLRPFDRDEVQEGERIERIRQALESGIVLHSTMDSTLGARPAVVKTAYQHIWSHLKLANTKADTQQAVLEDDERYLELEDLIAGSGKLVAINKGESAPDDRDALYFKKIYSTGDLIAERIKIDADKTARTLMRKLSNRRSLQHLPSNFLSAYATGQIVGNPLSSPTEETNPLLTNEQLFRITQMGPGGIGNPQAITESMQNVNPSSFGFIDPVAGPECYAGSMEVMTAEGWKLWPDVTMDDLLLSRAEYNQLEYVSPLALYDEEYEGLMVGFSNANASQLVTPNHRVWHSFDGQEWQMRPALQWMSLEASYFQSMRGEFTVHNADVFSQDFKGRVYCATVPSGMLFVKGPIGKGFWSGNSERAGIDVRATHNSRLGSDGRIYQRFLNPRLKQYEWLSARDLVGKTVAFNS